MTCKRRLAYYGTRVSDVFKALADPTPRAILDEPIDRDGQTPLDTTVGPREPAVHESRTVGQIKYTL